MKISSDQSRFKSNSCIDSTLQYGHEIKQNML